MGISFETCIELVLCLVAVILFRSPLIALKTPEDGPQSVATTVETKVPAVLNPDSGWDLDTPLPSATIPSITVSPAQDEIPLTNEVDDPVRAHPHDDRTVSFAQCAVIVEDIEPFSATSSETLPSSKTRGTPTRRGSDHIRICSVLAQTGESVKHTLKGRPLTPFIKFTGEEPLTAQVGGEFDTKDISSIVIGKSMEGGATSEEIAEIESVTFATEEDLIKKPLLLASVSKESE
jgi:hypothetical protein